MRHSTTRWEAANSSSKEWDCEKRNHSSHIDSTTGARKRPIQRMGLRSAKYVNNNTGAHVKEPNKEHDKDHAEEINRSHARTMARTTANRHGRRHTNQGSGTATIQKTVHK